MLLAVAAMVGRRKAVAKQKRASKTGSMDVLVDLACILGGFGFKQALGLEKGKLGFRFGTTSLPKSTYDTMGEERGAGLGQERKCRLKQSAPDAILCVPTYFLYTYLK